MAESISAFAYAQEQLQYHVGRMNIALELYQRYRDDERSPAETLAEVSTATLPYIDDVEDALREVTRMVRETARVDDGTQTPEDKAAIDMLADVLGVSPDVISGKRPETD